MWVGRSLARSFFRLQATFRWRAFRLADARAALPEASPRVRLTLSRLERAGWLARVARGWYVALDARWAAGASVTVPITSFKSESFYPALVGGTAGALQYYGTRLRGLALFGSAARRDHSADSDVDLLVIADPLPASMGGRLDELQELRSDLRASASLGRADSRSGHDVQFVPMTTPELRAEPSLLLDLTQDAVVLYDPSRVVSDALEGLSAKLRRRGARRVASGDGPAYWQLHPGARLGEVQEL